VFEQIKRDRLYKLIIDQITRAILLGEKRPGDQLPAEPELAEQFGVSRTVVREAIKALNVQGLVEVTPGRGTFITHPPIESVTQSLQLLLTLEDHPFDELMVARRILEVPLARLAAENLRASSLKALGLLVEEMRESLDDPEAFVNSDTAFHDELARATQNIVLSVMIKPIIAMMHASREIVARVPDMAARALHCHEAIYEACAQHDGDAAEQAMRDHLDKVAEDIARARKLASLDP
jgi:DNA-binding FadR family transcriptional regulator